MNCKEPVASQLLATHTAFAHAVSSSTTVVTHWKLPLQLASVRSPSQPLALVQLGATWNAVQFAPVAQQLPEAQQKPFWQWSLEHSYVLPHD